MCRLQLSRKLAGSRSDLTTTLVRSDIKQISTGLSFLTKVVTFSRMLSQFSWKVADSHETCRSTDRRRSYRPRRE